MMLGMIAPRSSHTDDVAPQDVPQVTAGAAGDPRPIPLGGTPQLNIATAPHINDDSGRQYFSHIFVVVGVAYPGLPEVHSFSSSGSAAVSLLETLARLSGPR